MVTQLAGSPIMLINIIPWWRSTATKSESPALCGGGWDGGEVRGEGEVNSFQSKLFGLKCGLSKVAVSKSEASWYIKICPCILWVQCSVENTTLLRQQYHCWKWNELKPIVPFLALEIWYQLPILWLNKSFTFVGFEKS